MFSILGNETQAMFNSIAGGVYANWLSINQDLTFRNCVKPENRTHYFASSSTHKPSETHYLTFADIKGNVFQKILCTQIPDLKGYFPYFRILLYKYVLKSSANHGLNDCFFRNFFFFKGCDILSVPKNMNSVGNSPNLIDFVRNK